MRKPKFVKYALAVAAATAGLLAIAPATGNTPAAQASPIFESPEDHFGPVDTYALGDNANCYIDYTTWIARDPNAPSRVVGYAKARDIRATVPGLPAPANCTATLIPSTAIDFDAFAHPVAPGTPRDPLFGLEGHSVRLTASRFGSAPVQVNLPYQPGAKAVVFKTIPQSSLYYVVSYAAYPMFPPAPATALRLR